MSASVGGAESNFGLNVAGKNNAVPAVGSEPMFNGDPWQLRFTEPAAKGVKRCKRGGWILQLLCEVRARGFRVSQVSGEPRRPLISSISIQ